MATPKTQKTQKKLRKTCIRASDIESQTHSCEDLRFFFRFSSLSLSLVFLVALRFSMRACGFYQGLKR